MVEINYNGTVYSGRLISLVAVERITKTYVDNHYEDMYENIGYDLTLMDAFGATIYLNLDNLSVINFV